LWFVSDDSNQFDSAVEQLYRFSAQSFFVIFAALQKIVCLQSGLNGVFQTENFAHDSNAQFIETVIIGVVVKIACGLKIETHDHGCRDAIDLEFV
jgi:hypothetical protein